MTAKITGFHTRADLGLRAPRSISRNIHPGRGGVAVHYGGGPQGLGAKADHARCVARWRSWQNYHMNTHGWADIAYTGGFCDHGYAFAGRGAGIRTGANGTNAGNNDWYAITWIGGDGEQPTQAALNAADWWLNELRGAGGAGMRVVPHRFFKATGCPGNPMAAHAALRDGKPVSGAAPAPTPGGGSERLMRQGVRGDDVRTWQGILNGAGYGLAVDGIFGPATEAATRDFQAKLAVGADGIVGPQTRAAVAKLLTYVAGLEQTPEPAERPLVRRGSKGTDVRHAQSRLNAHGFNLAVDGVFGPRTDTAVRRFQRARGLVADGIVGPLTWAQLG